jgi:uncharacterized protein YneF (UPF0154 family)
MGEIMNTAATLLLILACVAGGMLAGSWLTFWAFEKKFRLK